MKILTIAAVILVILGFIYGYITPQSISDTAWRVKTFFVSGEAREQAREVIENVKGVGGSFIPSNPIIRTSSSSAVTLVAGVGNTQILASSTVGIRGVTRTYVRITNNCTNVTFLDLNNGAPMPANDNTGIMLAKNADGSHAVFELKPNENMYYGAIHASSSAACELNIFEGRRN